ncbi:Protein NAS-28 [Aphelenchoides avenae]|nr:Protein NAS-28 [Aphelenchus avenae]
MLRVLALCSVVSAVLHWTSAAPTPEEVRAKFLEEYANQPGYGYLKRIANEDKKRKAVQRKNVAVQDPPELLKRVHELEANGASKNAEAESILKRIEPLAPFLYQGDMLLPEHEAIRLNFTKSFKQNRAGGVQVLSNGQKFEIPKWPHETPICYRFKQGSDAVTMEVARQAFRFWTENSCLTWQENCVSQPTVVISTDGDKCFTMIGRAYSFVNFVGTEMIPTFVEEQKMSLGSPGCSYFGTAAHEASHVMGMWHEQSRPDRDSYIDIKWSSITEEWKSQYNVSEGSQTYGIPYDYGSNMQYDGYTNDSKIDMAAKEKIYQHTMGNKYGPIFNDLKFVNMYNDCMCKGGITCQNGGFPHPRQCTSKCICPEGFGGATCAERQQGEGQAPAGCGATVEVSYILGT